VVAEVSICAWLTYAKKKIYETYAKQLGMMVRRKDMKNAINILAMIFAWEALTLSIFAFGGISDLIHT